MYISSKTYSASSASGSCYRTPCIYTRSGIEMVPRGYSFVHSSEDFPWLVRSSSSRTVFPRLESVKHSFVKFIEELCPAWIREMSDWTGGSADRLTRKSVSRAPLSLPGRENVSQGQNALFHVALLDRFHRVMRKNRGPTGWQRSLAPGPRSIYNLRDYLPARHLV